MAKTGTLTVRVVADTKAAEAGLDKFNTKIGSTGDKLASAGRKMTVFASVPVAAAMGVATKAASDLQQAVGGTEAVFGEAADQIDRYADTAAKASGLSEREFREATTSIGGQLKRMTGDVDLAAEQSVELTRVAADLAATYGGTTADAVAALGSAFRGEADPAERFNLNLKISAVNAKAVELGLARTETEVDDNAKAQATLALIMEQSADAQGQFARESDSAAGSMQIARAEMENASAEIGSALLPHVANLAGGVADLAQKFGELPGPVQSGILAIAGIAVAAGPILTVVGNVAKLNDRLRDAEGNANRAGRAVGGFAKALGGVAALTTAVNLVDMWADATTEGAGGVDQLTASLLDFRDSGRVTGEFLKVTGEGFEDLGKKIELAGNSPFSIFDSAGIREVQTANKQIDDLDKSLASLFSRDPAAARELFETIRTEAEKQGTSIGTLRDRFNDYSDAVAAASNEQRTAAGTAEDAKDPIKDLGGAADDAKDPFDQLEDSIRGVNDALQAQFDPLFGAQDALIRNQAAVTEAQEHYNEVVAEFGRRSPEAVHAAHQIDHAERLLADANRDAARTALDVTTASNELARKLREGVIDVQASKDQIRQWADQGLITEDQARQMAAEIDKVSQEARELDGQTATLTLEADISDLVAGLEEATLRVMGFNQAHGTNIPVYRGPGVQVETAGEFDKGGIIPGPRGSRQLVVAHGGETVLPTHKPGGGTAGVVIQAGGSLVTLNGGDHDANSIAHHIASFLARR